MLYVLEQTRIGKDDLTKLDSDLITQPDLKDKSMDKNFLDQ